jgi:adenine-specific DNA methylase
MIQRRLIEETFPLKKVSEHSKHEKNVRHGHISTLHIWPARRPLAACRAVIIGALLPDPGDDDRRNELSQKIASITKWQTENSPALDYFRQEIKRAFPERPPRLLDMFAGGGSIPLEAMRLGCEVTAIDYNPVAWFILKCTLEFPQRLAGQSWPLPVGEKKRKEPNNHRPQPGDIVINQPNQEAATSAIDVEPVEYSSVAAGQQLQLLREESNQTYQLEGDLADHVRYWGRWVLAKARAELSAYYPTINGQPTVAYLWARTVPCPDPACGSEVPLLKTLWLCQKAEKHLPDTPENRARPDFLRIKQTKNSSKVVINGRRALRLLPNPETHRVDFEIWAPDPKDIVPDGTMSEAKSRCPVCGVNIPKDYIKMCGQSGKLGTRMTTVVVDTSHGKEYRLPTIKEEIATRRAAEILPNVADQIPNGLPTESLPDSGASGANRAFTIPLYGFKTWADLFTSRQLLSLVTFVKWTRIAREEIRQQLYPEVWIEAVIGYLAATLNKAADYNSTICTWHNSGEKIGHTFARFALPITWDFAELPLTNNVGGAYRAQLDWIARYVEHALQAMGATPPPTILKQSATESFNQTFEAVVTDPPYYDAIPYGDLSDFFYVWLRRLLHDQYPDMLATPLTCKNDELVQQNGQQGRKNKAGYEAGMTNAFNKAWEALTPDGRMVIVFAHKDPEAWETLTEALIQAGFTVTASWPIGTEMGTRTRAMSGSAALASSIWLVCRKRPTEAGVGRYRAVRQAMEKRVTERLRYFWDMGLSGPDFVWAAIGPALESYSSYQEVRRLDGSLFTVSDFLKEARRMVADFALGQILKGQSTEGLDEWSRYYLMHRNDFGLEAAPVGECILLSQGYGLDLNDLRGPRGFILKAAGGNVRLARWDERHHDDLGEPQPSGGLPLIDILHRLMWLWAAGDMTKIRAYAGDKGLRQNRLFWAVAQAILEMAEIKSRERALLEALVAWGRSEQSPAASQPLLL